MLGHIGELSLQCFPLIVVDGLSIDGEQSRIGAKKRKHQVRRRGLPRSAWTHEAHGAACCDGERDPVEGDGSIRRVAEPDIPEFDRATRAIGPVQVRRRRLPPASAAQPQVVDDTLERRAIDPHHRDRMEELLHRRKQPIGRQPQEGELREPGPGASARIVRRRTHEQRHADQTADRDALERVLGALPDHLGIGRRLRDVPTTLLELAPEDPAAVEDDDLLDAAEALLKRPLPCGVRAGLQLPEALQPIADAEIDEDVAAADQDRCAGRRHGIHDHDGSDDRGDRDQIGQQVDALLQDPAGDPLNLPGGVADERGAVLARVEQIVAVEILVEERDLQIVRDPEREAGQRQLAEQVDDVREHDDGDQPDPESHHERTVRVRPRPLVGRREPTIAFDERRFGHHREERHHRGDARHRRERHEDRHQLQQHQPPLLPRIEQSPEFEQDASHGSVVRWALPRSPLPRIRRLARSELSVYFDRTTGRVQQVRPGLRRFYAPAHHSRR